MMDLSGANVCSANIFYGGGHKYKFNKYKYKCNKHKYKINKYKY